MAFFSLGTFFHPRLAGRNFLLEEQKAAHPLIPAVKLGCFFSPSESDEYFNFWGNYMTLNETKLLQPG